MTEPTIAEQNAAAIKRADEQNAKCRRIASYATPIAVAFFVGIGVGSPEQKVTTSAKAKRIIAQRDKIIADANAEAAALSESRDQAQAELDKLNAKIGVVKKTIAQRTFEGDGIYLVGADVKPGMYRARAVPDCYWARLRSVNTNDIINNGNENGPVVIQIQPSDKAIEVHGCGTFTRI